MSPLPIENARTLKSWRSVLFAAGVLAVVPEAIQVPVIPSSSGELMLSNSSTATVELATARPTDAWKAELRSRYDAMPRTAWFRDAHENKSLGEPVQVA
jgi:hypothetical protein